MSRRGGYFFEEFLIETKGAKTMGNVPAGPNNYPAPNLAQLVRKIGGYKINVARPAYNEHFFEEFLIKTKGAKTTGNLPRGPE